MVAPAARRVPLAAPCARPPLSAPIPTSAGPLRRALRRLRFTGDRARARLVLGARYVLDVPSTRLDPLRGERIVTWLDAQGFLDRGDLVHPRPASLRALRRVHADAYLESLREPTALESILGFGDSRELLDSVVAMQRAMTGGTQAAVDRALPAPGRPTINLGGGLHHAAASRGAGFCVFNDIAVAIADQRAKGFAGRVLVVDLDLHDGEGTRSIFASDPSVFTFSCTTGTAARPRPSLRRRSSSVPGSTTAPTSNSWIGICRRSSSRSTRSWSSISPAPMSRLEIASATRC